MEFSDFLMTSCFLAFLFVVWCLLFLDSDLTLYLTEKFGRRVSSYRGKVIWITGASSGLGEAIAYELASIGAKIVLTSRNNTRLQEVKEKCLATSRGKLTDQDILVLPFNLTDHDIHETKVSDVLNHFGEIDVLINNAGILQYGLFENTSYETDEKLFAVNVLGCVNLTRLVLKHFLEKKKGQLVVISSLFGKWYCPLFASYCATKYALHGYFESLRAEICNDNIDITIICPGMFRSSLASNALRTAEIEVPAQVNFHPNEMNVSRCAHLTLVAAANKLYEAWFSHQPLMLLMQCTQYMPNLSRSVVLLVTRLTSLLKGQGDFYFIKYVPQWKPFLK